MAPKVVMLGAARDDIGDDTAIRYVRTCGDALSEADAAVEAVRDYIGSGRYVVHDGGPRPVTYGDIAVICRKNDGCRLVLQQCKEAGIPAFIYADVNVMSTREGKLALAWLRFVNNEQDPWGYVPILADMNYSMAEIRSFGKTRDLRLPEEIVKQRNRLRQKRRRITELLTMLFGFYNLDNDYTQAIISAVSSAHRGSLITISDIITMMEEDIRNETDYRMDLPLDRDAVKIMTMHKSKGLEFPIVIAPFIDSGTMPKTQSLKGTFIFNENLGLRCSKEVHDFDGYVKICPSWRTSLAKIASGLNYDEERRLMFVTMSRAKQYATLICGENPSGFMKELSGGSYSEIEHVEIPPDAAGGESPERPSVDGYTPRRMKLGVHDIMDFGTEDGSSGMGADEVAGKGIEYGTMIHNLARLMHAGIAVRDEDYPELPRIRGILDSLSDADLLLSEIECGLPLTDPDCTLRGIIDLLAVYPDRVEVHDYKTDATDRFETEYRVQLSVYGHAASAFYGRPAKCFIDYVSRDVRPVEFEPLPISVIKERVRRTNLPESQ